MNRIVHLSLLLASLALVGCGSSSGGHSSSSSSGNSSATPSAPAKTPPENDDGNNASNPAPPPTTHQPLSLTLSWSAPTTRTDGSALPWSAIGGYEISYFNSSNQQFHVTINDPTQTSVTLRDLPPDSYEFRIFAFDSDNRLSPASATLSLPLESFEII